MSADQSTSAPTTAESYPGQRYIEELIDLIRTFEFELCAECNGDADAHAFSPDPLGHPHAWCRTEAPAPVRVEVVVLRHPDASNAFETFINGRAVTEQRDGATADGVTVITHDIDAGSCEEAEPETIREWADYHRSEADKLLTEAAAAHVRTTVDVYDVDDSELPDDDEDGEDADDEDDWDDEDPDAFDKAGNR